MPLSHVRHSKTSPGTENQGPREAQTRVLGSSWQTHDSARGDSLQFRGEGQPPGEDTPVPGFGFRDAHTFSSHTFFSRRSSCVLLRENSRGFPPPPQPLQCFWEPASPAWTAESDHKTMKTEPSGGTVPSTPDWTPLTGYKGMFNDFRDFSKRN